MIVPVPGALRFSLELDLGIVAAVAAWFVWPAAAVTATVVVVLAQLTGWRRSRWLILGALPFD